MLRIRNSEVAKFKRCQRAWYVSYYLGLEKAYGARTFPASFDTGNAVHAGLEAYYLGGLAADGINRHKAEMYETFAVDADIKAWDKVYKMAHAMVEHYPSWVDGEGLDIGESTLSVEKQIEFPCADAIVTCKPDRLVETHRGLVIEDWKTGKIDRPYMFEGDWQMLNYGVAAWMETGEVPFGARHRRLNRSMHTAAAKAPQYAEHYVVFSEERLLMHIKHLERAVENIIVKRNSLNDGADPVIACPPNRLTTCNWDCNAQEICSLMDDQGDWQYVLVDEYKKREDIG